MIIWLLTKLASKVLKTKDGLRMPCPLCCLKHLGQARALMLEARKGYATFFWFALGHLAEAEDELAGEGHDLVERIREERKALERNPAYQVDFEGLMASISTTFGLDPTEYLKEGSNP
jgi:hypothetical protein